MRTFRNKKILITGGAGFIGSHLAQELLKSGCRITIVDKISSKIPQVKSIPQNLKRFILNNGLRTGYDFIFHLAGTASVGTSVENPFFDFEENLYQTLILLEALRSLKKSPFLIYASSAAVYGIPKKMPVSEESPTLPVSPYGVSKLAAERYVRVYSELYHLPAVNCRFFSVYGPGQRKQVIFDLISKIQTNPHGLAVLGDPNQTLDLIYIDDLLRAIILVTQKSRGLGEVYNIASGKSYKMAEIVRALGATLGIKPIIRYSQDTRPGTNLQWRVDISKIKQLGFRPEITLAKGLTMTQEWFEVPSFSSSIKRVNFSKTISSHFILDDVGQ